ncbi:MAG TPA: THUMP domain-containing protein [Methanocella sp.]|uniref:class I SAM-dependent methyltransferase n=1 Tax=Methanocella sp. TaxID=2052833 RepID=UPI002C30B5BE|nr:THUMP domain-containing protein [Methanocella sp.]HTY90012.1 THUMP domain-containing protein [Methanocella sp.]
MRRLVFELSGEHATLPKSEVIGCIEAYGYAYAVTGSYDQALVVDTDADVNILARRLALSHHILELIFECRADKDEIKKEAEKADIRLGPGETFLVRVRKVREYGSVDSSFERELGAVLWHRGHKVDLNRPDAEYRAIITEDKCIFGRLVASPDRGQYEERAPLKKPFFLPGVLMPRISRAIVNMARIRSGYLLDPMSGTGGILVEGELIGDDIHVVGCDIQKKMAYGTRWNLRHYGKNYDVIRQDSPNMAIKGDSIDAMVTDFPYGQSTPIMGASLEDFHKGALKEMYRVLKPGRYAVVVYREPMEKLLKEAGFNVIETHEQYIHRSLTRHISLVRK